MGDPADGADGQRRVLYLTTRDVSEPRTGADNRSKFLYEGLAGAFDVDLVHFDRTADATATDVGRSVPYPSSELLAVVSVRFLLASWGAIREGVYDAVVASGIGAATYGLVASWLAGAPFVFDDHNVEADVARDVSLPRYPVVAALERLACARARLLVVPTSEVAATLTRWGPGAVEVVTNGFDAETFRPTGEIVSFDGPRLLFFGNFHYAPNREAVAYIVDELAPRIETAAETARILLAGPGHEVLRERTRLPETVELLGFVDDLPATIRGVDVVIVPLRSGSGSRLKIIEALACETPVVSTPIGAAGWPTDWTNLTVADLDAFADTTVQVLADPTFDPGDREAIAAHSWQAQSRRFVEAIHRLGGVDD